MNPVQYIFLDRTLEMSTGKAAAQAAHASVEGALTHYIETGNSDESTELWYAWREGKHYAKVVLETDDLFTAKEYLESRGFRVELIIDEGRTEFGGKLTPTAIGTMIVDKDDPHTRATFGEFDTYGTHNRRVAEKNRRDIKRAMERPGSFSTQSSASTTDARGRRILNHTRSFLRK